MEKHTPESVEINIEAAGSAPLFDVRLKVVTVNGGETCVSIVPGLPEIENSLMCIVDDVVAAVKVRPPLPLWQELFQSLRCSQNNRSSAVKFCFTAFRRDRRDTARCYCLAIPLLYCAGYIQNLFYWLRSVRIGEVCRQSVSAFIPCRSSVR